MTPEEANLKALAEAAANGQVPAQQHVPMPWDPRPAPVGYSVMRHPVAPLVVIQLTSHNGAFVFFLPVTHDPVFGSARNLGELLIEYGGQDAPKSTGLFVPGR